MTKAADAFRTISEVADDLGIPKHVLRFWEAKFTQIRPMKRGGGRRYYRPEDLELLKGIRQLLHRDGYTIKGVQKILREQGVEAVKHRSAAPSPPAAEPVADLGAAAKARRGLARHKSGPGKAAATPSARPVVPPRAATIAAVLAELEACRALLKGERLPPGGYRRERRIAGQ